MAPTDEFIRVMVHYIAAGQPFKDDHASGGETVGQLKQRVLTFFHLTEGQSGGSQVTYTLYHDKTPLENLNQTLGAVAGDKKELQLNLNQQITGGDE